MKFKLDENIGQRGKQLFINAGYDVTTVVEENITSASDLTLIKLCQEEDRCLVTLDLDFSNPLIFPPSNYCGIVILRPPKQPSYQDLIDTVTTLIEALKQNNPQGKLWIVQRGNIRIYQDND